MVRENNYRIKNKYEENCFSYCSQTGCICLKMTTNTLSGIELSEYVSDAITHEHIHKILDELFNSAVCKLFDGIEEYFGNHILHEKELKNRNKINNHLIPYQTYKMYIEKHGFNAFLSYYDLTQEDVTQANIICNSK